MRQWAPLAAVVVLLGAGMLATLYANPQIALAPSFLSGVDTTGPEQTRPPVSVSDTPFDAGPEGDILPSWVTYAVSGFCLLAVLAVLGWVGWLALRERIGQAGRRRTATLGEALPTLEDTRSNVRGILDAGLADLDTDQDPRRAIIACWLRLERAATVAGVEREAADTSTDLADRLVSLGLVVRVDALAGLAELYRQARYAPHDVDQTMRERARAALVEVRAELGRWPGVRPVGSRR